MKYLVKYKDNNSIEGYLDNIKDFDSWLFKHNKIRQREEQIIEYKDEFEIIIIHNLMECVKNA